ncbi:RNA polymerase, sigma 54 (sigma N) factor [Burkholderiales bacterium]|nr:RNA polymerase, sigma 54 (sigma N) factor [Burkholderiales bacterium]
MKTGVHLRLSQQLALTPQLQQSIRLLQLSTLELNQEIEQALQENPLLERDDDPSTGHMRLSAEGSVVTPPGAEAPSLGPGENVAEAAGASGEDADYGAGAEEGGDDGGSWNQDARGSGSSGEESNEGPQDWATTPPNLREHLRQQLGSTAVTDHDRALVSMLIDAVDESGYLGISLEELLELCGAHAQVDLEELLTALSLLQSFDPPGVGARNVSECLRLQLDARIRGLPRVGQEQERSILVLARKIVCEHLPLLAARDFAKLRKTLDADDALLRAAHQRIRGLNPHPGVGFGSSAPDYVIPDILVRRVAGRWAARLNPDVVPRLRVNQAYAAILKTESGKHAAINAKPGNRAEAGAPAVAAGGDWAARLQDARWLIRNLRQRFQTIERVAQAIVERQSRFFTYGAIAMRPLVLREIATTLGLHESTISRVTSNKYMATPFGVFELRYFFGSHVATEAGGEASSTAIRALIKQLIEAEEPTNPLSDSKLADLLAAQGMMVARRTVAKYRELMQIPPAALRKTI